MTNKDFADYSSQLITIRHDIHQHPELGFEEHRTSDIVADYLTSWGYEVHRGLAGTGVVGTLKVGGGNKRLGLRADMDALPILENNGKPWVSTVPKKMHACGHDGHTTMLLGAARYLAQTRNFDGTLHLIFQPAEEMLRGGAVMVEQGLFDLFPCDAIFAMHNMPGMAEGEFFFRPGSFMASMDEYAITVQGCGGHGAVPHLTIDPVVVASHITVALQSIVSRNIDPLEAAIITVGSIQAGEAANVIPDRAEMKLSVRALKGEVRAKLRQRILALVKAQAESFGASAEVNHVNGAPVLVNDEAMTHFAYTVAVEQFGAERAHNDTKPLMGSEDFAFMLDAHPQGSYLIIGNGNEKGGCMVHNPGYDFNDRCLVPGCQYWCALVEAFLKK
ncbi:M20 aminoacylase family protein [Serratia sp. NPDC078593]|uniref:M20 aminoacylase family protein n=1 Tax=unclassified Serratia (in: enterobacteria) TaxID=2647522 RepID=UPI0037D83513